MDIKTNVSYCVVLVFLFLEVHLTDKCDCSISTMCQLPISIFNLTDTVIYDHPIVILYSSECVEIELILIHLQTRFIPLTTLKLDMNSYDDSMHDIWKILKDVSERTEIYVFAICISADDFEWVYSQLPHLQWISVEVGYSHKAKSLFANYCRRKLILEKCNEDIENMMDVLKVGIVEWPGRKSFQGTTLKVAYVPIFPFVYGNLCHNKSDLCDLTGIDYKMVETISDYYDFRAEYIRCVEDQWGQEVNGSWNGLVGMLYRKETDMAVGALSETVDRETVVDFTSTYYFDTVAFVVKAPDLIPRAFFIFIALDKKIYFTIIAVLVISAYLINFISKGVVIDNKDKWNFGRCVWYFTASLLGQGGVISIPKNNGTRIATATWQFFGIIISTFFSGVLVSNIYFPPLEKPVDTIPALAKAVKQKEFYCGTLVGSSPRKFFEQAKKEDYLIIAKNILNNPQKSYPPSYKAGLKRVLKDHFAFILPRSILESGIYDMGFNRFNFAKDRFYMTSYSIGIQEGSCLKSLFNKVIWTMAEAGMVWKWQQDTMRAKLWSIAQQETERGFQSFTVEDMQGCFVVLLLGYAVSFFVFIAEIFYSRSWKIVLPKNKKNVY